MNFLAKQRVKRRIGQEVGTLVKPGATFRVGLAYPNKYFFGMSNLGFQTLYRVFNQDKATSCERIFLPESDLLPQLGRGSLTTYEQGSTGSELDLIAFSISYQNDYLNVIPILFLLGLAHRACERKEEDPMVIAGGPAVSINPEPLAHVMDAFVIGEGEEVAQRLLEVVQSPISKEEKLKELDRIPGVYVPSLFSNDYQSREVAQKSSSGFGLISGHPNGPGQTGRFVQRLVVGDPERGLAQSEILTPETEFGDMYLIEVQRGCQWGCRFCAAGFMYRYPRYDSREGLKRRILRGLQHRKKVGLIAGDLLGHDSIHEILDFIDSQGGSFSPSSVRLNAFTPKIIHHLKKSGNRTVAIAPEAGSERLRRVLNKTFTNEEVVEAAVQLAEGGIQNIKLYIMVGLPTETEADLAEMCQLTQKTREALTRYAKKTGKMPSLTLSVSPFVPKPSTPMQYFPFVGIPALKKSLQGISKRLLPLGHIRVSGESPLDAFIETLLSRGDRRVLEFLEKAIVPLGKAQAIGGSGHLRKALAGLSFDPDRFVTRPFEPEEACPWDFIDHGIKKSFNSRELDKIARGVVTPYCRPEVCRSCGVC